LSSSQNRVALGQVTGLENVHRNLRKWFAVLIMALYRADPRTVFHGDSAELGSESTFCHFASALSASMKAMLRSSLVTCSQNSALTQPALAGSRIKVRRTTR